MQTSLHGQTAHRFGGSLARLMLAVTVLTCLGACRSAQEPESLSERIQSVRLSTDVDHEISALIDDAGGTPLVSGEEVLFLARSDGAVEPRIIGDFNQGGASSSEFVGNGTMRQIGSSNWFELATRMPPDAHIEYQIQLGRTASIDPLNPRSVQTFGTMRSVLQGSRVRSPKLPSANTPRGRLEQFVITSQFRGNERDVSVYLPPGYRHGGPRLATLYVKDGSRFRSEGSLPAVLDAAIAAGHIPPVVVVFVDPVNRALEYGTARAYRKFVTEELVPDMERRYASGGTPELRALFGASRGGLAVVDLGVQHPEVFGFAAAMSPAIRPLPMIEEIAQRSRVHGHFVVLVSQFDSPRLVSDGAELIRVLESRANGVVPINMPIDHSIHGWKRWLDVVMQEWGKYLRGEGQALERDFGTEAAD